jgi:hypothetical protein
MIEKPVEFWSLRRDVLTRAAISSRGRSSRQEIKDMKDRSAQLRKQPSRFWRLGESVTLLLGTVVLLTGDALSSFKQSTPSVSSSVVLSEQKRKELFLTIRKGPAYVPLPLTALPIVVTQPHPNFYKESVFAAGWPADSSNKALRAQTQLASPRGPLQPGRRLVLKKGNLRTTVATAHTVESIFQRKPAVAKSAKSSGREYRYLTPAVRRAIDRAPIRRGRWKYFIIHNSGTRRGNARAFDAYHRRVRRMKNGLAYHFVIGNGRLSGNGEIEVGNRWRKQINGGHVASDYLNNIAVGICLVGDFNRHPPTPQQLAAFEELTSCLQARIIGRSRRRRVMVLGHLEVNSRPTDCPGRRFSLHWLHRKFPSK